MWEREVIPLEVEEESGVVEVVLRGGVVVEWAGVGALTDGVERLPPDLLLLLSFLDLKVFLFDLLVSLFEMLLMLLALPH